jgi:hypothetical protein
VARIRLVRDATVARDPLFAQVLARRSNKEAFDTGRPVPAGSLAMLAGAARQVAVASTSDPVRVESLRAQAWDAFRTEMTTYETMKESVDLMRIGRAEIEASPDGIDIGGAFVEGMATLGLFRREDLLDSASPSFARQLPYLRPPFDTAMAFLWLTTPGNMRAQQIDAGRDHVRLNLAATGMGLGLHPLSQALQEFAAMRPHLERMREALGVDPGETLQMLVRLGYGPAVAASPRWPYETRIRHA